MKIKLKQKEKCRQQKMNDWKKHGKQLAQKEYNYLKSQQKYEEEVVLPDLERYKRELKNKREYFKPIDGEEIKTHEKKYKKLLKERREEKKRERLKWYHDIGYGEYDQGKFKTKLLENFLQNEKLKKDQVENKKREKSETIAKADKYAKFVKEMHWPKISKLKRQEMETIKDWIDFKKSLNRSTQSQIIRNRSNTNRNETKILRINDDYVSSSEPTFSGLRNVKKDSNSTYSIIQKPKRKWKENNMIPKPKSKKEPKVMDYLMNRRMKREQIESTSQSRYRYKNPYIEIKNSSTDRNNSGNSSKNRFFNSRSMDNYRTDKTTIDPYHRQHDKIDRFTMIREKARQIEANAMRKEQLMKVQGSNADENADVNDMLIDSITAKLRILDEL